MKTLVLFLLCTLLSTSIFAQDQPSIVRDTLINGSYLKTDGLLIEGLEEGYYHYWTHHGTLKEMGAYKKGSKTGLWYFFDFDGNMWCHGSFLEDDSLIEENIRIRSEVVDTLPPGPIIIEEDTSYDDFEDFGDYENLEWTFAETEDHFPAQKLFQEIKHGKWTYYDDEGDVIYYEIYDKGNLVKYVKLKEYKSGFDDLFLEDGMKWEDWLSKKPKKKNR